MAEFFQWLSNNPVVETILIVFLCILVLSIIVIYLVAFFQGRDISFFPPKIGQKPDKAKPLEPIEIRSEEAPKYDLTGIWKCDDDATYYVRQLGIRVFWCGELRPEKPKFCNVAYGSIYSDEVKLEWADIPKGANQHFGTLVLKIYDNGTRMIAISKKKFGGSTWVKVPLY